jgi:hypothetical protein
VSSVPRKDGSNHEKSFEKTHHAAAISVNRNTHIKDEAINKESPDYHRSLYRRYFCCCRRRRKATMAETKKEAGASTAMLVS